MGFFKTLFYSNEMAELEEIMKLLLDKIRNIYNNSKKTHYQDCPNSSYFLRVEYGYGTIIRPDTNISFGGDIVEIVKEHTTMDICRERIIIIKKDNYNKFIEMSAEFSHKANRYLQLLRKTETSISRIMQDVITNYKYVVVNFNYSYKYVVE